MSLIKGSQGGPVLTRLTHLWVVEMPNPDKFLPTLSKNSILQVSSKTVFANTDFSHSSACFASCLFFSKSDFLEEEKANESLSPWIHFKSRYILTCFCFNLN